MSTKVKTLRVAVETGPKGKKCAAFAVDWPGLERGGKTAEGAVDALHAYVPRYAEVAKIAGMQKELLAKKAVDVVETYPGPGSTDFWGISFGFSSIDREPWSTDDLDRHLTLLQASWTFFDDVRGRVSAEMKKGPRGGGRDRDRIVQHVLTQEQDWATKVGLPAPEPVATSDAELRDFRRRYCAAVRAFHAEGKAARNWPLRYLIRHTAFHALDHAWEMQDKDLSAA